MKILCRSTILLLSFLTCLDKLSAQNDALKILPNGNVGIGTPSPDNKLSVSGIADFSGMVGIGKVRPDKPLDVAGVGGIRISRTEGLAGTPANNEIFFQDNGQIRSSDDAHRLIFDRANNIMEMREFGDIVFSPGATGNSRTQTVTFKSGGRVGIGTSTPGRPLEVNNAMRFTSSSTNADDGVIGTAPYLAGLNIVGINTDGGGRKINTWGSLLQNENPVGNVFSNTSFSGRVGIGTSTPSVPLEVGGFANYDLGGGFWFAFKNEARVAAGGAHVNSISIKATAGIQTTYGFFCTSDSRTKTNFSKDNSLEDLRIVNQLQVKEYQLIDSFNSGVKTHKGFVAQEVEKLAPGAIDKNTDFIPDIYAIPIATTVKSNSLLIRMKAPHHLVTGDKIRIFTNTNSRADVQVSVKDMYSFSVSNWTAGKANLFVFGKQVRDFHILDYNYIFTMGISAIQELSKQLDETVKGNETLKETVTNLQKKMLILESRLDKLMKPDIAISGK